MADDGGGDVELSSVNINVYNVTVSSSRYNLHSKTWLIHNYCLIYTFSLLQLESCLFLAQYAWLRFSFEGIGRKVSILILGFYKLVIYDIELL